jgi:hypothetical protein
MKFLNVPEKLNIYKYRCNTVKFRKKCIAFFLKIRCYVQLKVAAIIGRAVHSGKQKVCRIDGQNCTFGQAESIFRFLLELYTQISWKNVAFIVRIIYLGKLKVYFFLVRTVHSDKLEEYCIYCQDCTCTYYTE